MSGSKCENEAFRHLSPGMLHCVGVELIMIVGVPTEIKDNENRVSTTPGGVSEFVHCGHTVLVERGAGAGSGFADNEYTRAGAVLIDPHAAVFEQAEMIVKVKEPVASEYALLRCDQLLFTYL